MIIYKIENTLNSKVYIGQTVRSLNARKRSHKHASLKPSYPIHLAIAKYGFDNFTFEIVCECQTQEELDLMERFYIWAYGSTNKTLGYNLESGGNTNKSYSEQTLKKMSSAQTTRFTKPEEKEKHSKAMKLRFLDPSEHENTSKTTKKAMENWSGENHPNSKLTWEKVNQIRDEYRSTGISQRALAQKFGISQRNVLDVLKERIWKTIP